MAPESSGSVHTADPQPGAARVQAHDRQHLTAYANPTVPPTGTLSEMFLQAVDEFDKADAQLYRAAEGWQRVSHREVLEHVMFIAQGLDAAGIRRGDRIALLSENRPEWAWVDYALLCSGIATVPVYPTLPANQIAYILQHAGVRAIFVSTPEQLRKVLESRSELAALERIYVFDAPDVERSGVETLAALMQQGSREPGTENDFRIRARQAQPDDVATLIYTSGTTGDPKGVMLTHNNLYSNVAAIVSAVTVGPADTSLSFLPLSHVLERVVDFAMFAYGCTIAYVASIDRVTAAFGEVRPTIAVAVPRVYEKMYAAILGVPGLRRPLVLWAREVALEWARATLSGKQPDLFTQMQHALADRLVYRKIRERIGGQIRFFVSGGAPLNPVIAQFFYGAGILILEGYGLTETSPVTNVNTPDDLRPGTVGKPIAGTEIRIAEDGEILVRGPQVMKGYFRNPEATREAIDPDGWLRTGDIGEIDGDGFLRITDRKKDLLVTAGGKNIAPQPIENAAKRSRFVSEAVMIGDRRPYPVLLVVPNFDTLETWSRQSGIQAPDRESLVADSRVREKIEHEVLARLGSFAHYELPRKVLPLARELSLESGEITPTLKVKRRVVGDHFREVIEALYAEPPATDDGQGDR